MKKLFVVIGLLVVFVAPAFLPLPLISSDWHSQYALGDTISVDLAAWNTTPIPRSIGGEQPTQVVLAVDGSALATTTTDVSAHVAPFARVAQTINYKIDRTPGRTNSVDSLTGTLTLTPGPHDITLRWLGSSTWPQHVTIVQL